MTTQHKPKVSVVMSTYNRAHMLPYALASIQNQTLADWELIIVDDASTDNTAEVVRELMRQDTRLHYYRHEKNSGLAIGRNTSFQLASGHYIALQDDDDISRPSRLEKQAAFLDRHPSIAMVSAGLRLFYHAGFHPRRKIKPFFSHHDAPVAIETVTNKNLFPSGTLMARCHVWRETPMRPFFQNSEDSDFRYRCIERYTIGMLAEVLYDCRLADHYHHTLSTQADGTVLCLQDHMLAWVASFHRRRGWQDPVDQADTIDDFMKAVHPDFVKQAAQPLHDFIEGIGIGLVKSESKTLKHQSRELIAELGGQEMVSALNAVMRSAHARLWKGALHFAIRSSDTAYFAKTLKSIPAMPKQQKMLLSFKLLFACLRYQCFAFMLPIIKSLLTNPSRSP